MTRHRQGQSLSEIFTKKCLACSGSGQGLEDFNWMLTSGGGPSRSKMPIRQQSRTTQQTAQKQVPKAGGRDSIRRFVTPQREGSPMREGFLQQSKAAADHAEKAATATLSLLELFQHRITKKYGIRLASIVKMACLPLATNVIVTKINAKATDVFTLVNAIEDSTYMPQSELMEGDFDEALEGDPFEVPTMMHPPLGAFYPSPEAPDATTASASRRRDGYANPVALQERPLVDMTDYEPVEIFETLLI
jgi:hypothetical protein